MTDTMHAHPVSSGPGVGDHEAAADERDATSDELRQPLPWEMDVPEQPAWVPEAADAVELAPNARIADASPTDAPPAARTSTQQTVSPAAPGANPPASVRLPVLIAAIAAGVMAIALIAAVAIPRLSALAPPTPARGQISIVSDQPARVSIDGKDHGPTPLDISLDPGPHALRVTSGGSAEAISIMVTAGAHEVHHVHSMGTPAVASATGNLRVSTTEPGARIILDGEFRGLSPMLFAALAPGTHSVVVSKGALSVRRDITIDADRTIELDLVPAAGVAAAAAVTAGWIEISSPFDVEIWEAGTLIGSSRTARLMLSPGSHSLDLVNQTLAYRGRRSVEVAAGRTTALRVAAPQGTLSVNATPWADVWVDGARVGETPLGDISLPIGSHDVVLRHPDLGERHVQSIVRVGEVTRLALDLRRPATQP